ncbi:hypothetical protein CsSME_00050386 [Camellia sinensis var. sinensis]
MSIPQSLTILFPLLFTILIPFTNAATFAVLNKCTYTVWAAAKPGGGMPRIWGRTNCNFNASGNGQCQTGDCNGLLECQGYGQAPNTLAEFALNQPNNLDFFDISLVNGFNIPLDFSPTTVVCKSARCAANIVGECPTELQTPGGCNNPCTVFKTNEYCCTDGPGACGPTRFSKFFKDRCPDTYSNPDSTSLFTCPAVASNSISRLRKN